MVMISFGYGSGMSDTVHGATHRTFGESGRETLGIEMKARGEASRRYA
jgi:hypothetical protein